jgi:hypothetical protein
VLKGKTLRIIFRILRSYLRQLRTVFQSLKYLYLPKPKVQHSGYLANLLVVKKPVYARIAKLCVESFLYFNPSCEVVIHVDSMTQKAVSKKLRKLIKSGRVSVRLLDTGEFSWQELKLDLALKMIRKNEFFMDADLRWNGPIPKLEAPKFFVKEFSFEDREPYSTLIRSTNWEFGQKLTMKNTSFIYWGTSHPNHEYQKVVGEVMKALRQFCNEAAMGPNEKESLIRISEQVALSTLVDFLNIPVTFLKEIDRYRDGAFVESSYFGATGTAF